MATAGPSLGRAIKDARTRVGMTQAQLARALGVQQNVVARLEDGGRADPRFSTVLAIAQALGVSVDALAADAALVSSPVSRDVTQARLAAAVHTARTARAQLAELDASLEQFASTAPPPRRGTSKPSPRRKKS